MAGITTSKPTGLQDLTANSNQSYRGPLVTVTMLFFMWGFITCLNDILIPKMKAVFTLQHWQAMLIQTAFFGAYFIISLLYFLYSITKGDPILKIGYKNGIIVGLVIAAGGCLLFYPAAAYTSYSFFLLALFVLASGITILQIAANPYVSILGPAAGSSSRMSLTQALNALGTTIAPVLGGYLIFDQAASAANADSVKLPYLALAAALLVIALVIRFSRLPRVAGEEQMVADAGALRYRHLVLGIICIFMYVGGEVSIGSALISYLELPHIAGLPETESKYYLAFFWGGAMVGRFFGAVALADMSSKANKYGLMALLGALSFGLIFGLYGLQMALITGGLILFNVAVFLLGKFIPSRTLGLFAAAVIGLLLLGILAEGPLAMWAVIATGLFNSIMFPTIFDLAIKGLGIHTSQGSSLLVMAIVGGAIIPPLQGLVADLSGSVQLSFLIPLACYLYILYYGFYGYRIRQEATGQAAGNLS